MGVVKSCFKRKYYLFRKSVYKEEEIVVLKIVFFMGYFYKMNLVFVLFFVEDLFFKFKVLVIMFFFLSSEYLVDFRVLNLLNKILFVF